MHHTAKRRRTEDNAPAPSFDLTITGEACRVQQKKQSSLQESGHLIQLYYNNVTSSSWNDAAGEIDEGDGGSHDTRKEPMHLLVDRHDARTLMDELSLQQLCHQRLGPCFNTKGVIKASSECRHRGEVIEEASQEEIDQRNIERFGMPPVDHKSCTTGGKIGGQGDTPEGIQEINDEPFQPTEEQRRGIPTDVLLPKTMRQHSIIELTAARVSNNPQLEIFLKLKQSNNSNLSFINTTDELHPYYIHLKGKCSGENQASDKAHSLVGERKSGLNVLLAGYDSSSSDEDRGKASLTDGSAAACTSSIPRQQKNDEKIRGERLERLRQWKESKNLQTTDNNE